MVTLALIPTLALLVMAGAGVVQAVIGSEFSDTGKHFNRNIVVIPHHKIADIVW
jgi:hypothetical protein